MSPGCSMLVSQVAWNRVENQEVLDTQLPCDIFRMNEAPRQNNHPCLILKSPRTLAPFSLNLSSPWKPFMMPQQEDSDQSGKNVVVVKLAFA